MTFEEIRQVLTGRVVAWAGVPVAYDGMPESAEVTTAQGSGEPWARATIVPGDSFTASIGDGPKARNTGLLMMQVFVKPPDRITADNPPASIEAYRIASSLAEHLSYYQNGYLVTRAASMTRVGPSSGYYQVNVSVPYVAD